MTTPYTFRYRTDGGTQFASTIKSSKVGAALWREITSHACEEVDAENERYRRNETLVALTIDRHPFET
jgi:hypothetical protein